jgi:hypothetical protein
MYRRGEAELSRAEKRKALWNLRGSGECQIACVNRMPLATLSTLSTQPDQFPRTGRHQLGLVFLIGTLKTDADFLHKC